MAPRILNTSFEDLFFKGRFLIKEKISMKKKIINFGLVLILLLPLIVFASGFKIQNENYRANHTDTWERIKKRGTLLIGVDDTFVPMDFRKKNGQLVGYDVDLSRAVVYRCRFWMIPLQYRGSNGVGSSNHPGPALCRSL